ncbi:MAG: 16S rRNA (cytidine(1402)-2'-O)-methyltransferase [Oscillospiraceae bacterium]|jgi:16S rRNA (cytidine1402-2'-O)-methyltransferase|nr:16S rRNA (cytidine(1402)-2'-O)-methyltransferase [Oscillospiraceae bacterium]
MLGKLIILGTPIGNLKDFSPRAQEALKKADLIAAEDTRVTRKLLNYFDISKPLISYFEYNKKARGKIIIGKILDGKICVLVSDAGMPIISDPGEELVQECAQKSIPIEVVPGPSALTAALAVSGLPSGRFTFEGFLSTNKAVRRRHIDELRTEKRTMIFYEAPHKLAKTLSDLFASFGDRKLTIAREMTKIHEEIIYTTLKDAIDRYKDEKPRGEIALVIEGSKGCEITVEYNMEQAVAFAKNLSAQGYSKSDAAKRASHETKFKRSVIYKALIESI